MNLHSCQSTKRKKKKGYPWQILKKVCVLCSIQSIEFEVFPRPKLGQKRSEMFWHVQKFFSFSNYQILGSLFFTWGILHMIHSSFLLPFYPLRSLAFLFSFDLCFLCAHFLKFIFVSHRSLPIFQNTLLIWISFHFYNHRALSSFPSPYCLVRLMLMSVHSHRPAFPVSLAQQPWETQAPSQGKRFQRGGGWPADSMGLQVPLSKPELTMLEVLASDFHSRPASPYTGQPPAKLKSASFRVV